VVTKENLRQLLSRIIAYFRGRATNFTTGYKHSKKSQVNALLLQPQTYFFLAFWNACPGKRSDYKMMKIFISIHI